MANKYVSFVSDEKFMDCINFLCEGYVNENEYVIDPIRVACDVYNKKYNTVDECVTDLKKGSTYIAISGRIGRFHQKLLGKVEGWEDLPVRNPLKVDLKRDDNSVFIELKNKFNTMNTSSNRDCRNKLEELSNNYPDATIYWAYIITANGDSGEKVWEYTSRKVNDNIKIIWGEKVYELITGNPNALGEMWNALPVAINSYLSSNFDISENEKEKLNQFFYNGFYANKPNQTL